MRATESYLVWRWARMLVLVVVGLTVLGPGSCWNDQEDDPGVTHVFLYNATDEVIERATFVIQPGETKYVNAVNDGQSVAMQITRHYEMLGTLRVQSKYANPGEYRDHTISVYEPSAGQFTFESDHPKIVATWTPGK